MKMTIGNSGFVRDRGEFPELPVVNMFAEEVPTEEDISLLSRSGLDLEDTYGAGPIRGLYQQDGVLDGQLFIVSAGNLYGADDGLIGAINGSGEVSFAGYENYLFVCAGTDIWSYDGAVLAAVAFPGGADVLKICIASSRLIAIEAITQTFFWSDPLSTTIDALSFAEAERSPDKLEDMLFIGDVLILFGRDTVEFWPVSDDDDLPFQPLIGRVYESGIKQTGAAVRFNKEFAWITDSNEICFSDPDNVISFPGLQKDISDSNEAILWTFDLDGDECLVLSLDDATWVFHSRSKAWTTFETYGEDGWIVHNHAEGYFGSKVDGKVYSFGTDYTDDGDVLERRFRAWMPINSDGIKLSSLILRTNPGQTTYLTGDYTEPVVELRLSRDGGFNWDFWKSRSLGIRGKFRRWTLWNSLGKFGYPGVLAEFRVTDPISFRVSGVVVNEPRGGI